MKKTLAIVAFVAVMLVAGKAQAQLSVNLGYAPETFVETAGNDSYLTVMNGFFLGATYNINLVKDLGLSVGGQIRWNTDSGSSTDTYSFWGVQVGETTGSYKSNQILVDVPILVNYGFRINRNMRISPFVGPTINFGIYGKTSGEYKVTSVVGSTTHSISDDWYSQEQSENNSIKRFNLSATAGVAFSFKQFRVFGGYNYGLLNVANNANVTSGTSAPFFGLSYIF